MTIKQCIKKNGWNLECELPIGYRAVDVDVAFTNNGSADETQFTLQGFHDTEISKLDELYTGFCKCENIPRNTVVSVSVVNAYTA